MQEVVTKSIKTRREMFRKSAFILGGIGIAQVALGAECTGVTPTQPSGPFYPSPELKLPLPINFVDNDLVRASESELEAAGEVIILTVLVTDSDCKPISNAKVDLWQACSSGKYNHPDDPNEAILDKNFQYQGIVNTNGGGKAVFRTIKPGAYPAAEGWVRPPHIHITISAPGFQTLTTQMYFEGEALNSVDKILKSLPPLEKQKLIVDFSKRHPMTGTPQGEFAIGLKAVW